MDPGAVLTELGKRFDDAIRLEDDLTKAALKRGRALATTEADQFRLTVELPPAGGTLPGASEIVDPTPERRVHLAWDADADRLEVRMLHEWTGHAAVRWVEAQATNCPPGAPCREAPPQTRQQAWTWGATRTARFVVDARGEIVEAHIDPIALTGLAAL